MVCISQRGRHTHYLTILPVRLAAWHLLQAHPLSDNLACQTGSMTSAAGTPTIWQSCLSDWQHDNTIPAAGTPTIWQSCPSDWQHDNTTPAAGTPTISQSQDSGLAAGGSLRQPESFSAAWMTRSAQKPLCREKESPLKWTSRKGGMLWKAKTCSAQTQEGMGRVLLQGGLVFQWKTIRAARYLLLLPGGLVLLLDVLLGLLQLLLQLRDSLLQPHPHCLQGCDLLAKYLLLAVTENVA